MLSLNILVGYVLYAVLMYGLALIIKKMSLMDIVWSLGLGIGGVLIFQKTDSHSLNAWLSLGLILLWSVRMGVHLFVNRILSDKEDSRYQRLINHSGKAWKLVFLAFFLLQIFFIFIFLFPIKAAIDSNGGSFGLFNILGFVIGILALVGETLSDNQLKRFSANIQNKGKVCKEGFWRYSRHPNYFFEWLFWFSFVGLAYGGDSFYWSLVGPIVMYLFLRYITGVPFAELSSLESRGDAYKLYQKETNVFFLWFPKL